MNRLAWADMLRIFAIYLVLVVHTTVFPKTTPQDALLPIILFSVAKTCVPLFFMLSGALLLSKKETVPLFFKKRFLRIIRPYIFWVSIFIVLLFFIQTPHSVTEVVSTIKTGLRVFWFLPIIFVLYIFTPALRIFLHHAGKLQVIIPLCVWCLLVSFLPYVHHTDAFPLQTGSDILTEVTNFSGYFVLGYLLTSTRFFEMKRQSILLILIGILWTIIGTIQISTEVNTINLSYFEYVSPSIVVLSVGIFSLFLSLDEMFNKIKSKRIKKAVTEVSVLVFGVYLLHTLMIQIFPRMNISIPSTNLPSVLNVPIVSFFLFTCTLFVVLLLSKIPYLKKFVS